MGVGRGGQGRVGWSMMFGEEMQKRESPDFRFPEVGISVIGNQIVYS